MSKSEPESHKMQAPQQKNISIYWEDLPVGTVFEAGQITIDREESIEFARRYDPQPFHLDEEAAANTYFKRLSTSGWHTCSLVMRLLVDQFLCKSSSLGSPGLESLKWFKPVYPGDTLTVRQRAVEARLLKSRPGVGLIRWILEAFNQDNEKVLLMDSYMLMGTREAALKAAKQATASKETSDVQETEKTS
jgi:acyl dehydratase